MVKYCDVWKKFLEYIYQSLITNGYVELQQYD